MKIPVIRNVLEESDARARENRTLFDRHGVFVLNMMSSPGAGKTTLLQKTIPLLQKRNLKCAVIEGDITSTLDSEKLSPLGIPVVQANTEPFGGDCHVGSHLVQAALAHFDLATMDVLFIENIGNLVCPAEFDLGEDRKVVVLSITEGEDKPVKYPLMFRECKLCLLSKMDLAPHLDVDLARIRENIRRTNAELTVIPVSAKTGEGVAAWCDWIVAQKSGKRKAEGSDQKSREL
ncbi:MAG: hydrogenase nickel incorporation protein HypB [bacterium]|nr:hydrogenase nickel incorporation protein HypB [bacterium]